MAAGPTIVSRRPAREAAHLAPAPVAHVACMTNMSPEGGVAEAHAAMLAHATGAMLSLYHAIDVGTGYRPDAAYSNVTSAAARLARATLEAEARKSGVLSARRQVVIEELPVTAAGMAAAARRLGADMVVMAPRRHGFLSRALGFSLTEATVDALEGAVPVLCARGEAHPYRRIVVATDFSAGSRRALRLAGRLSAHFGSAVTVLHAVPQQDGVEPALAALRRFIPGELGERSPRLVVGVGEPCAVILGTARASEADLVVVSTRGRDSLRDAVVGTHAQRVIRDAECPVIVA
jgi:nucleotide-binding universal stress UspA family protein